MESLPGMIGSSGMETDHPDSPWIWNGDGTDALATLCADAKILITAEQLRSLLTAETRPLLALIRETNGDLRCLLDHVPECRGGGEDRVATDDLGHVIYESGSGSPSCTPLSSIVMNRVIIWIEELDLALGQLRSFARTGDLGTERLTLQERRISECGLVPDGPTQHPMPDDALIDVLAEIGRLAQLATRRKPDDR